MIEGLRIQMTSDELAARLSERATWNEATALDYEDQLRRRPAERDHPAVPDHVLHYGAMQHRARATTLRLLLGHLVPGETYLLDEHDLQFGDLAPQITMSMSMVPPTLEDELEGRLTS